MPRKQCMFSVKSPLSNIKKGGGNGETRYITIRSLSNRGSVLASTGTKLRPGFFTFFRFLPPVKSYNRTLEAIKKLRIETYEPTGTKIMLKGSATLSSSDVGFNDLVILLRKNLLLENWAPKRLILHEVITPSGSFPPSRLQWLNSEINGDEKLVISPLAEGGLYILREMAEKNVRRDIANISGILILVWLLIMTFMISLNLSG